MARHDYGARVQRSTLEVLRRDGRREPLLGGPNPLRPCVWCSTMTQWRLREFAVCLTCNDKPENRGEDGLANVELLRQRA